MNSDPPPPTPPYLVSLTSFTRSTSPTPRRLSSHFTMPSRPIPRQLAWISLQGRLIGAEEASSARSIGGGLSRHEAVAWELFSPIHRVLIVAVVAVAVSDFKRNQLVWQLRKSIQLRDQVLLSMQQKLDDLCEQVNNVKDQSETDMSSAKNVDFPFNEAPVSDKVKFVDCGCWHCDKHQPLSNGLVGNSVAKSHSEDETFKYKIHLSNEAEQEERRMSDLSDWGSSVTSSADIQFNSYAIEHDIYNLKRECEEKEANLKELSAFFHSSDVANSKRITELEDIIRRKNMIITKLKKDMVVLEQKVVQGMRLRRSSFSVSSSKNTPIPHPVMTDNLLYDMDSTTSPSSSDSDCSPTLVNIPQALDATSENNDFNVRENKKMAMVISSSKSRPVSPLKEKSMNQRLDVTSTLRPKQSLSAGGEIRKSRRRNQMGSSDAASHRRWV